MASGDANATSGELLAPEKIAPRGNSPVIQPPSKNFAKSLQKELPINV